MTFLLWGGFIVFILSLLALDLGLLNKTPHAVSSKEALKWTALWVTVSMLFNVLLYFMYENHWLGVGKEVGHPVAGSEAAINFFTAYLVEYSLSMDNIFVIAMIFSFFKVPKEYLHRVLFWGVMGALVLRGVMIVAGIAVIQRFEWLIYVFGAILIFTAIRMLLAKEDDFEPDKSPLIKLVRKFFPVTSEYHQQHFMVKIAGKNTITPLGLCLVVVEGSDVLFAVDSIPAVFSVTLDPFIVFTSNVFAILGLRSLFFALDAMIDQFRYLKISLVFILGFVGAKMMMSHHYKIHPLISLGVIAGCLLAGVLASMIHVPKTHEGLALPMGDELGEFVYATLKTIRRVFILVIGVTILLIGIALLVLPGPGVLVILGGLALLATEFVWARIWMTRVQNKAKQLTHDARDLLRRTTGR